MANHIQITITILFFSVTSTTKIYTLSLHDALPILAGGGVAGGGVAGGGVAAVLDFRGRTRRPSSGPAMSGDRKSTRLNSSHVRSSYAVFCLKKKKIRIDIVFMSQFHKGIHG